MPEVRTPSRSPGVKSAAPYSPRAAAPAPARGPAPNTGLTPTPRQAQPPQAARPRDGGIVGDAPRLDSRGRGGDARDARVDWNGRGAGDRGRGEPQWNDRGRGGWNGNRWSDDGGSWRGSAWRNASWYGRGAWCGPSWYSPAWCGPSWYGGSGFSLSFGWSSYGGWNVGFGWSSGGWCAPAYAAPAYCGPAWYGGWGYYNPVWYGPAWYAPAYYAPAPIVVSTVPFYAYPEMIVVTNYVERYADDPAPNFVALDGGSGATSAPAPGAYIVPSSASMAAWSAMNSGELAHAGMAFQDLLLLNPTDARALMGRGIVYMLEGNDAQATACFRLAIGSDTGAINGLPLSTAVIQRVRDRAEVLWSQPESDAAFVAAVGYAAINEPDLAFRVASRAIELGDRTLTTAQLRSQLSYALNGG